MNTNHAATCRHVGLSHITTDTDASKNNHDWRTLRYGVISEGETPQQLLFWMAAYLLFCLAQAGVCRVCHGTCIYMTQIIRIQSNGGQTDD